MIPLTLFTDATRRLILIGDDALPPAYGPIERGERLLWDPLVECAALPYTPHVHDPLADPNGCRLPLDHWTPRLALVCARLARAPAPMVRMDYMHAIVRISATRAYLSYDGASPSPALDAAHADHYRWSWNLADGRGVRTLPSLPQHIAHYPPVVALLLALETT